VDSGIKRVLDYADYVAAPEDGQRYEIVGGDLFVSPPPRPVHQRVSRRLQRQLEDHFHTRGSEVFNAPIALILTPHDVVEPDLLVVDDPRLVSDRGIEGPPLLVVEILSASTRGRDRGVKARRYAELGVRHYWLVDPDARRIECLRLGSGGFELVVDGQGHVAGLVTDRDLALRVFSEAVDPESPVGEHASRPLICGEPAMDREFKTIDFLTLLDLDSLPAAVRRKYLS